MMVPMSLVDNLFHLLLHIAPVLSFWLRHVAPRLGFIPFSPANGPIDTGAMPVTLTTELARGASRRVAVLPWHYRFLPSLSVAEAGRGVGEHTVAHLPAGGRLPLPPRRALELARVGVPGWQLLLRLLGFGPEAAEESLTSVQSHTAVALFATTLSSGGTTR
jgi:hypothetical protein